MALGPGLSVVTTGTLVTDDATVTPERILLLRRRGSIIYADTTADFIYTHPAKPRLYPRWISAGSGNGEILVQIQSPPDLDFVRRFHLLGRQVVSIDTLPAFDAAARNLDSDSLLEYSGYRHTGEIWDDAQGHRWTSYNPKLYYEVRPTGLVLDSVLTKQKALAHYGVFRGFGYSNKPGIRIKKS